MSKKINYFFLTPAADDKDFIDFGLNYGTITTVGETVQYSGTSMVDSIFVRPGLTYDLTSTGGRADKIYLTGSLADYTAQVSGVNLTLSRTMGTLSEVVTVAGGNANTFDNLVFANGTVKTNELFAAVQGATTQPTPDPTETSLAPLVGSGAHPATQLSAVLNAFAAGSATSGQVGETFASTRPGITFTVTGGAGVDTVYVADGGTVDASNLGGSQDLIYMRGNWADYIKSILPGGTKLQFTRIINGHTETVVVANGNTNQFDKLIFADGAVATNNAKAAVVTNPSAPITDVTGHDLTTVTPLYNDQEVDAALAAIRDAAQNNSATDTTPRLMTYVTAGVTGVTAGNLVAINSALESLAIDGAKADTAGEVQAIVAAYKAILAAANGASGSTALAGDTYAAVGVTGVAGTTPTAGSALALMDSVIDLATHGKVDTVGELQAIADAAARVMAAAGGTPVQAKALSQDDFTALGITGVTPANLWAVQSAIEARTADTDADSQSKLQAIVNAAINGVTPALAQIQYAAENNLATAGDATHPALTAAVFNAASINGVDANNIDAINSALDSAAVTGSLADTQLDVQTIVNGYNAILASADGTHSPAAPVLSAAVYTAIGVTGLATASGPGTTLALLDDVVDLSVKAAVDTEAKVQAMADAAGRVISNVGTPGGSPVTAADLTALGVAPALSPTELAAVQTAIQAVTDPKLLDTQLELQTLVNTVLGKTALNTIAAAAEANNAATALTTASYSAAGVTGITATNLASINSALDSAAIDGARADTLPKVQAIVDAFNAILSGADGTGGSTPITAAQYFAIGVMGVTGTNADGTALKLLDDVADRSGTTAVDTTAKVQALADAAARVMALTANPSSSVSPSAQDLDLLLGNTDVTAANLVAIQNALQLATDAGVDTRAELQALVTDVINNVIPTALSAIQYAALNNVAASGDATHSPISAATYAAAGVTGVDAANLAAINSALDSAPISDTQANTTLKVQAIVDGYKAILANADGWADSDPALSGDVFAAVGVTGLPTGAPTVGTALSLLSSAVDQSDMGNVDSVPELQAMADAAKHVMADVGAMGAPTTTLADLQALDIAGVTPANLAAVQAAIKALINPNAVDTQGELQRLVDGVLGTVGAALLKISAAAQNNNANGENAGTALTVADYVAAGVTGVTGGATGNLASINSALNSAAINADMADTTTEVQAVVDGYNAILASADGMINAVNPLSAAQYASIGVTGLTGTSAPGNALHLLDDVVDQATTAAVDTESEVQALADAAKAVIAAAGTGTATGVTKAGLQALLGNNTVTDANLAAVQAAIGASATLPSGVDTKAELQALVDKAITDITGALSRISTAAEQNSARNGIAALPPLTAIDYAKAGVSGVDAANLAAINSALDSDPVNGLLADTTAKVQAIVDSYKAILAEANGSLPDATTSNPTLAQFQAIGVTLGTAASSAAGVKLLDDVIGGKVAADVDTIGEINDLAAVVNKVMLTAADTPPTPTLSVADLAKLGLDMTGVTNDNMTGLRASIAATINSGDAVDSLSELQGLINALDKAAPTLASASPADEAANVGTSANVVLTFNENVQLASSGTITLHALNGTATDVVIDLANPLGQVSVSGSTLTINPIGNLTSLGQYAVRITAGAVTDLAGNAYAGLLNDTTLNFTTASTGTQVITGTSGDDLMTPTSGQNGTTYTDANGNQIDGSDGINDSIDGAAGNDTLNGGAGNDTINGGSGDDTFVLTGTFGTDTIVGGETGENLGDTMDASGLTANTTLTFSGAKAGTLGDGTSTATFSQIERIKLGSGNDTVNLASATGAMNVDTGAGNDTFVLNAANITKMASAYNGTDGVVPHLAGGTGLDTLRVSGGASINLTTIATQSVSDAGGSYGSRLSSIELIDLKSDTVANTLTLTSADVVAMADTNAINAGTPGLSGTYVFATTETRHQMIVDGTNADSVVLNGGFVDTGKTAILNGHTYEVYNQGSTAQVLVDTTMTRSTPQVPTPGVNLSVIEGGSGGFVINGMTGDQVGRAVSNAGDVNGDGLDDMIVSGPGSINAGKTYVVFGRTGTTPVNLSDVSSGVGGFLINGAAADSSHSVSAAGDINGDGLADIIIGAHMTNGSAGLYSGTSYVVYGKTNTATVNLASLGTAGFALDGAALRDESGYSLRSAGDVNGDGLADLIIGAPPSNSNGGRSFVVFGKANPAALNLASVAAGTGGFVINGASGEHSGYAVSSAGDVNGDGLADLLIGADLRNSAAGASYVVFGKVGGSAVNLSAVAAGTGGFAMYGQTASDRVGWSVSSAGDVNGDGLADVIVSGHAAGNYAGKSYVVFGKTGTEKVEFSSLGTSGFVINGAAANNQSGYSVSSAGDMNGDGLADLLIGARFNGTTGESYVVFGKTDLTAVNLSDVALGLGGFVIKSALTHNAIGTDVSAAGDINGDGLADLIVGAPGAWYSTAGGAYVILGGQQFATTLDFMGTAGIELQTGSATAETFAAGMGNDTLIGGGGADVMYGGAGNDVLVLNASNTNDLQSVMGVGGNIAQLSRADGGTGFDTIQLSDGANLDLTQIANVGGATPDNLSRINSMEAIDLKTDTAANTLTLAAQDVVDMAGMNLIHTTTLSADGRMWTNVTGTALGSSVAMHQLVVTGDSNDSVNFSAGGVWANAGTVSNGVDTFKVFQNDALKSQVFVRSAVQNVRTEPSDGVVTGTAGNDAIDYNYAGDLGGDMVTDGGSIIQALAGNDTITGGRSNDVINAGSGNDTIQLLGVFGNDTMNGGADASGNDVDLLDASTLTAPLTVVFTGAEAGSVSAGTLTATFSEMESFNLGSGNDTLAGGAVSAPIYVDAGAGNDAITTGSGADILTGGTGNDSLSGGTGNDTLVGGSGADTINSGMGNDSIDLGLGGDGANDVLVLTTGMGSDTVTGFEGPTGVASSLMARDKLNVAALISGSGVFTNTSNVVVSASGSNTLLTFVGGETLTLNGIASATVTTEYLVALGIPLYTAQSVNTAAASTVLPGHTASVNHYGTYATTNTDAVTLMNGNFIVLSGDDAAGNNQGQVQNMPLRVYLTLHSPSGAVIGQVAVVNDAEMGQTAISGVSLTDLHDGRIAIQYLLNTVIVGGQGAQTVRSYGYIYDATTLTNLATYDNASWSNLNNIAPYPMSDSIDVDANSFIDYGVAQNTNNLVANVYSNAGSLLRSYTVDTGVVTSYGRRDDAELMADGKIAFLYQKSNNDVVVRTLDPSNGQLNTAAVIAKPPYPYYATVMRMDNLSNGDHVILINDTLYRFDANFNLLATLGKPESTMVATAGANLVALADGGFVVEYAAHPTTVPGAGGPYTSYGLYVQVYDQFNGKNGAEIKLMDAPAYFGNDTGLTALSGGGFVATWATGTDGRNVSMKVFNPTSPPVVLDLNHDGLLSYGQAVVDFKGDGHLVQTAWVGAQDGILVWDKLGDGKVHNDSQYAFKQYGGNTDLQGLAAGFDSSHDGVLDARDAKFSEFMVWQDANSNGVSDAGELHVLAELGITAITLTSDGVVRTPATGVTELGHTTATMNDGTQMLVADASFDYAGLSFNLQADDLGHDTLQVTGSIGLNFAQVGLIGNRVVEVVDLKTDTNANVLNIQLQDVLNMSAVGVFNTGNTTAKQLAVLGDAQDTVQIGSGWTNSGAVVGYAGHDFAVYNSSTGAAQLLIAQAMVNANHVMI